MADAENLIQLTADIVSSMVGQNNVASGDVPGLIKSVHAALSGLGAPEPEPEIEKPKGAVSARASIKADGLISMIDGKKYQTLRRHITRHGYTPESYRETFGLPRDYPLTSSNYSELRRGMAKQIGLGRKAAETVDDTAPSSSDDATAKPAKRGRKPRADKQDETAGNDVDPVIVEQEDVAEIDAATAPDATPADETISSAAETIPAEDAPKPKRGRPRKSAAETATPEPAGDTEAADAEPVQDTVGEDAPAPRKRRSKKTS